MRRCHWHVPGAHWRPIQLLTARIPQPDCNLLCQQLPPLWLSTSHISSRVSRVQNHRPANNSQERAGEYMGCVWGVQSSRQGKIPAWVGCFWGQLEAPWTSLPGLWPGCPALQWALNTRWRRLAFGPGETWFQSHLCSLVVVSLWAGHLNL